MRPHLIMPLIGLFIAIELLLSACSTPQPQRLPTDNCVHAPNHAPYCGEP